MATYGKVKDAIKRKFPVIDIDDSLGAAIRLMAEKSVSVLAVKVREELIGIVTVSDVMHGLANDDDLEKTKISDFMTACRFDTEESTERSCLQLDEEENSLAAIKLMLEAGVNHLLVTGAENIPLGIVSSLDLVKLVAAARG
jgi:predicted transcriptional regulator